MEESSLASTHRTKPVQFQAHGSKFGIDFAAEFLQRFAFRLAVHGIALDEHFEVHAMRVEFGAIDAGEFALAIDENATTPAHAGAVAHDGIQADNGADAFRARNVVHGF